MGYDKSKKPVITGANADEITASLLKALAGLGIIQVESPLERALREACLELRFNCDYEDPVRVIQIVRAFLDNLACEVIKEIPELDTSMFGNLAHLLGTRPYCECNWAPSEDGPDEERA